MELSQEGQLPHKGASAPPAPPDPCHRSVTEGCEAPPPRGSNMATVSSSQTLIVFF